ncbi:MAG: diacylglycerol kinase family protein [Flavobacteriaceae bacterium]|nr:diacylglycerol kinase family protein [Flavobacteriaceae bacterium]
MRPKQSVVQAIKVALRGMTILLTERAFRIQLAVGLGVTVMGLYFEIEPWAWAAQTLAIGLVLMAEGINTALERISDFIQPDFDPKIGRIKDMAAGFVSIAAIISLIIAVIIYSEKLMLL